MEKAKELLDEEALLKRLTERLKDEALAKRIIAVHESYLVYTLNFKENQDAEYSEANMEKILVETLCISPEIAKIFTEVESQHCEDIAELGLHKAETH